MARLLINVDPQKLGDTWDYWDKVKSQQIAVAYVLFTDGSWWGARDENQIIDYGRQGNKAGLIMGAIHDLDPDIDGLKQADRFLSLWTTPHRTILNPHTAHAPMEYYSGVRPAVFLTRTGDPTQIKLNLDKFIQRLTQFGLPSPYLALSLNFANAMKLGTDPRATQQPLWLLNAGSDGVILPPGWTNASIIQTNPNFRLAGQSVGLNEAQDDVRTGPGKRKLIGAKATSVLFAAGMVGLAYWMGRK